MTLPQRPNATVPPPLNIRFHKIRTIRQIPPDTDAKAPEDLSPPTPSMDDTPYIRFAIDQLTRDEELMGMGRQGSIKSTDYPVQRHVPDEGLGYYNYGRITEKPLRPGQKRQRSQRAPERYVAVDNLPIDAPDIRHLPYILRRQPLCTTTFTILLMIAALIFCNIWSMNHDGFMNYGNNYDGRYFLFEYLPQLLGICIVLSLIVIDSTIRRVTPFMMMSHAIKSDRVLQDVSILPANFVLPNLSYFRNGEKLLGVCEVVFWLTNFTIPLLSCAFQTKIYMIDGRQTWRWVSVQGVIWTLVALYILLVMALLLVLRRFSAMKSALRWDPVSIADIVLMFQQSNVLPDYDQSEIYGSMRTTIPARVLRLGYWKTTRSPRVFYGIAEEGGLSQRTSFRRRSHERHDSKLDAPSWDVEAQRHSNASSFVRNIHSPFIRYRWAPWFLFDSAIVAWSVTAFILWLALVIVSFVNEPIRRGFRPLLPTLADSHGFSSSNFLYSFLPALLGMFLFLAWQPIDIYFRAAQPFASLSRPGGATAAESLLLKYPSCMPIESTIRALRARHFRVAWISFMSLLSAMIPVLAGGVFTAQYFVSNAEVRVAGEMPGYYLLVVILALYAFSFLIIWPTRKRYLPHKINTLAGILSFIYQSSILREEAFQNVQSKADLVSRLTGKSTDEEKSLTGGQRPSKYTFGVYIGRDGKEHLGIDKVQKPENGQVLAMTATIQQR